MTASKRQRFDFYILQSNDYLRFTCRLLAKAYQQHYRAIAFCDNDQTAAEFDRMLWTFKDISFIPHQIAQTSDELKQTPIVIWSGDCDNIELKLNDHFDLAVILTPGLSPDKIGCNRIACVVPNQEDIKQTARDHFKYLKQQTDNVEVHKLNE